MNFSFTKTKAIWIVIISLILGFVLALQTTGYDLPLTISSSLLSSSIFWFIILFLGVYLVWSFIERGNKRK